MQANLTNLPNRELRIDRRQRKTRLAVENALLELMQEKPLDTISISELSERADINRKTFYNNYTSIEDVLSEINHRITGYILEALPEKLTIQNEIEIYHLLLSYTTALEPHHRLLRQISQTHNSFLLIDHLKEQLFPYIERNLISYHVNPAVVPYIVSYVINGLTCLLHEWCLNEDLTPQQLALLGYNLTISAIKLDNYRDILQTPEHQ